MHDSDIQKILDSWGICYEKRNDMIPLFGSPNRSFERFAFEDTAGHLFIADGFNLRKQAKQEKQNQALEFLAQKGVSGVYPWIRTRTGEHGHLFENLFWQVRPFIQADALPQREYGNEAWRGKTIADFLISMKAATGDQDFPCIRTPRFMFLEYVPSLIHLAHCRIPQRQKEITSILTEIQDFLEHEAKLPAIYAHGDFHPGNILMIGQKISTVIDWEFCGMKTAGYDLALLLGCIGMDNPDWINGELVESLMAHIKEANYLPQAVQPFFSELIVATRLGWLGEWIDQTDTEMIDLELTWMKMLLQNDLSSI